MNKATWQLQTPMDAFIFDCDGTLSTLEGVDELAKIKGVEAEVKALTADAMGKSGLSIEVYQERLNLVRPSREQVLELGRDYFKHVTKEAQETIQLLQQLGKKVYIISAGLYPSVALFGELLRIPTVNIFAVNIDFDSEGLYLGFDRSSPLVSRNGKRVIVTELKKIHPNIVYIGDGLNDYETHDLATRFIGYGGSYYRENIAALCHYYIKTPSIAPLLPLSLTLDEAESLAPQGKALYNQGLEAILEGTVLLR